MFLNKMTTITYQTTDSDFDRMGGQVIKFNVQQPAPPSNTLLTYITGLHVTIIILLEKASKGPPSRHDTDLELKSM